MSALVLASCGHGAQAPTPAREDAAPDGDGASATDTSSESSSDVVDLEAEVGDDASGNDADLDNRGVERLADAAADVDARAEEAPPPVVPYRVARGRLHACAWRGTDLFCWGQNHYGQLGLGTISDLETPTRVPGLGNLRHVAAGNGYTCAVDEVGNVHCWGGNGVHQLGDGTTMQRLVPSLVAGVSDVVMVAAGDDHTCALEANGSVFCWGDGYVGGPGDASHPVPVIGIADGVEVAAGALFTCVRRASGGVSCWGPNVYGEVGNGGMGSEPTPSNVIGLDAPAAQIVAGDFHACALLSNGRALCWGKDRNGDLGDGLDQDSATPRPVAISNGETIGRLSNGTASCALFASGRAACWGVNLHGELGDGSGAAQSLVPSLVRDVGDGANVFGTCVIRASGMPWCWGVNDYGQVGDGTKADRAVPAPVPGLP
jgi:alpha-tubulin suppressor-like RCC1 family protein